MLPVSSLCNGRRTSPAAGVHQPLFHQLSTTAVHAWVCSCLRAPLRHEEAQLLLALQMISTDRSLARIGRLLHGNQAGQLEAHCPVGTTGSSCSGRSNCCLHHMNGQVIFVPSACCRVTRISRWSEVGRCGTWFKANSDPKHPSRILYRCTCSWISEVWMS